jgi:hypothetical protein
VHSFNGGAHTENTAGQGAKAAASGGIMVCIFNFILIYLFGLEDNTSSEGSGPEVMVSTNGKA